MVFSRTACSVPASSSTPKLRPGPWQGLLETCYGSGLAPWPSQITDSTGVLGELFLCARVVYNVSILNVVLYNINTFMVRSFNFRRNYLQLRCNQINFVVCEKREHR